MDKPEPKKGFPWWAPFLIGAAIGVVPSLLMNIANTKAMTDVIFTRVIRIDAKLDRIEKELRK